MDRSEIRELQRRLELRLHEARQQAEALSAQRDSFKEQLDVSNSKGRELWDQVCFHSSDYPVLLTTCHYQR